MLIVSRVALLKDSVLYNYHITDNLWPILRAGHTTFEVFGIISERLCFSGFCKINDQLAINNYAGCRWLKLHIYVGYILSSVICCSYISKFVSAPKCIGSIRTWTSNKFQLQVVTNCFRLFNTKLLWLYLLTINIRETFYVNSYISANHLWWLKQWFSKINFILYMYVFSTVLTIIWYNNIF